MGLYLIENDLSLAAALSCGFALYMIYSLFGSLYDIVSIIMG
jgi:hypothetical protein